MEPRMADLHDRRAAALAARGDVLSALQDEGLTLLEVCVIHPAGRSYVGPATRTAGAVAADRGRHKHKFYENAHPGGYPFVAFSV